MKIFMRNFGNGVVYIAIILHTLLFIFNIFFHPETFINADRARERLVAATDLLSLPLQYEAISEFLSNHGILGDYVFQAIIMGIVGQYGLIIFQIVLAILSYVCLYTIAKLIFQSERLAFVIALIYMMLPHSLVFPHQLISEAIFDPLLVFSFYFLTKYLLDRVALHYLITSAGFMGISALIRPVSILFPFVLFAILLFHFRMSHLKKHTSYLVISILPICIWMLFIFTNTGVLDLGKSEHDHGTNIYEKISILSKRLPDKEQELVAQKYLQSEDQRVSVGKFLNFVMDYPILYLDHTVKNLAVFLGKSDVNRLLIDVFGMDASDIRYNTKSWRRTVEQHGFPAFLEIGFSKYPLLIIINLLSSTFFVVFMLISIVGGGIVLWKNRPFKQKRDILLLSLYSFIFYILLASQIVRFPLAKHRSPVEFAIVIFFIMGCQLIYDNLYWKRQPGCKAKKINARKAKI